MANTYIYDCEDYSLASRTERSLRTFYKNPSQNQDESAETTHQYESVKMTDQSEGEDVQTVRKCSKSRTSMESKPLEGNP
jgi:hypothetical protein